MVLDLASVLIGGRTTLRQRRGAMPLPIHSSREDCTKKLNKTNSHGGNYPPPVAYRDTCTCPAINGKSDRRTLTFSSLSTSTLSTFLSSSLTHAFRLLHPASDMSSTTACAQQSTTTPQHSAPSAANSVAKQLWDSQREAWTRPSLVHPTGRGLKPWSCSAQRIANEGLTQACFT